VQRQVEGTAGFIVGLDIVALVLKLCTKGYLGQILGLSQSKIPGNTLSFSPLPVVIKISQNDNDARGLRHFYLTREKCTCVAT
jgi:hypothetical protein